MITNSFYKGYTVTPSKRFIENQLHTKLIEREYADSKKCYINPKITKALKSKGVFIYEKRVTKIMRLHSS